jgi:hypothetical protein
VKCRAFSIEWKQEHCDNMAIKALVYKKRAQAVKKEGLPNFHNNVIDFLPAYSCCLNCENNRLGSTPTKKSLTVMHEMHKLEKLASRDCCIDKVRKEASKTILNMIDEAEPDASEDN